MFWKKEKLWYDICVPPFGKPVESLDKKEAKEYFDWYMNIKGERIKYLCVVCSSQSRVKIEKLDLSAESLIPLWKWFLKVAKVEETPPASIEWQIRSSNGLIEPAKEQLSLQTEYIIRDIGMYLGTMFEKNHKGIYWSYVTKPRNYIHVNAPLLRDFIDPRYSPSYPVEFEPIHMTHVQAVKILDNRQSKYDLYDIYIKWSGFVPGENHDE